MNHLGQYQFCGEEEKWAYWSMQFLCRAHIGGYRYIIDSTNIGEDEEPLLRDGSTNPKFSKYESDNSEVLYTTCYFP